MVNYWERQPGTYVLSVSLGRTADGKNKRKSRTIKVKEKMSPTKLKAYLDKEWYKFEAEVLSGAYIAPEKMRFDVFTEKWKEQFAKSNYAETTYVGHVARLNAHIVPTFGELYMNRVTTMMINDFLVNAKRVDGKPLALNSRIDMYKTLRALFKSAVKWKVINENPMDGVDKPRNRREQTQKLDFYNPDEIKAVLKALPEEPLEKQLMFTLALFMGLRRSEILALEWKHIDLEERSLLIEQAIVKGENNSVIKEPKSLSSNRILGIPDYILQLLEEHQEYCQKRRLYISDKLKGKRDWIFMNSDGNHLYPDTVTSYWLRFTKKHKLRYIKLHDLRHTNASILLAQGSNPKELAAALGHADTRFAMDVYARNFKEVEHRSAKRVSSFIDSLND